VKVRIDLEKNETPEIAEELLYKALKSKRKNKHSEKFEAAGIRAIEAEMLKIHEKVQTEILNEILEVLK
jgi:hypothetical protein